MNENENEEFLTSDKIICSICNKLIGDKHAVLDHFMNIHPNIMRGIFSE